MKWLISLSVVSAMLFTGFVFAEGKGEEKKKKVQYRKTQEVNFEGADVDGQLRSPDGAYLLQKRGVRFIPLYKVNNQFEKNILESVEYLR